MPVTRSASRPGTPRSPFKPSASTNDVIIVSSDDEGSSRPNLKRTAPGSPSKTKTRSKAKSRKPNRTPFSLDDILEISSADELPQKPESSSTSEIAKLQSQIQQLQEENSKLARRASEASNCYKEASDELLELKATKAPHKGKTLLDSAELEDAVTCEICALKLWSPYILSECGHTFCQTCIEDWLNVAVAQHKAAHPQYRLPGELPAGLQNLRDGLAFHNDATQRQFLRQLQDHQRLQQMQPQPAYTCPTCREKVVTKPVQDFAFKKVVRIIAAGMGEESPRKELPIGGGGGVHDPWELFFPKSL